MQWPRAGLTESVFIGQGVPADKVHAALQSTKQAHELARVAVAVVLASENDVFKRQASLAGPIVFMQQFQHLCERIAPFGGHDGSTLFGEGIVQANGQMARTLVEKTLQVLTQACCRHGDATWALRKPAVDTVMRRGLHAQP